MKKTVITAIAINAAVAGWLAPVAVAAGPPEQPNLIVVLADDLSLDLTSALLAQGWLPNVQRYMIDEGVSFEQAFVTNSLCCPSRATYLRGQYTHNHGVFTNRYGIMGGIEMPGWWPADGNPGKNESTVATWLQDAGYATGFVGNYLIGYGVKAPDHWQEDPRLYIPPGWSDWQGMVNPTGFAMYNVEINDNGTLVQHGNAESDYQTDVLADRAVAFIEERAASGEPFFLSIMPFAPHISAGGSTSLPALRHAHLMDGDPGNGEIGELVEKPSFNEADISDKPACSVEPGSGPRCVGDMPRFSAARIDELRLQYKSMGAAMLALDDLLGDVMLALENAGLDGSTWVVFTSDNGWLYGEHRLNGKDLPYEESIRIPLYVRGPGAAAGTSVDRIVLNNDLAPTLAELAGATPAHAPDGTSFAPLLYDPGAGWGRVRFLVEHYYSTLERWARFTALRQLSPAADFLYVETYGDPAQPGLLTHTEFYILPDDPYQLESRSLPSSASAILGQLSSLFRMCSASLCRTLEGF